MSNNNSILFARGVIARLQTWPVLKLALQEGWGGDPTTSKSKSTWLASTIVDAFQETTPTPDDQYIEMMLLQILADEFDAVLEDGSAETVATDILKLWDETMDGKHDLVHTFEGMAGKMVGKKVGVHEGAVEEGKEDEEWVSTDEEDDDGDDDDQGSSVPALVEPKAQPVIGEDGFTLVQKGKR